MPSLSLGVVTLGNEEGVPGRGTEHPRALALAPGGDSGAVSTSMAIRAGAEWPLQTGRRHNNCARLAEYLQCVLDGSFRVWGEDSSSWPATFTRHRLEEVLL